MQISSLIMIPDRLALEAVQGFPTCKKTQGSPGSWALHPNILLFWPAQARVNAGSPKDHWSFWTVVQDRHGNFPQPWDLHDIKPACLCKAPWACCSCIHFPEICRHPRTERQLLRAVILEELLSCFYADIWNGSFEDLHLLFPFLVSD